MRLSVIINPKVGGTRVQPAKASILKTNKLGLNLSETFSNQLLLVLSFYRVGLFSNSSERGYLC